MCNMQILTNEPSSLIQISLFTILSLPHTSDGNDEPSTDNSNGDKDAKNCIQKCYYHPEGIIKSIIKQQRTIY